MRMSWVLLLVAVLGFGCNCQPPTPGRDGGDEIDAGMDAGIVPDAGNTELDSGVTDAGPPPELKVLTLLPPRGASAGGTPVLVGGSGFLRDFAPTGTQAKPLTTLRIGGNQVQDFQIIDDNTIEVRTPPGLVGPASVSIRNPNGSFVCNDCFTYFDELTVTSLSPTSGPLAGGNEVTLLGQGFTAESQVLFGSYAAVQATVVSTSEMKVVVPRGAAAEAVDVVVYNTNGLSTQRRAYAYVASAKIQSVSPLTSLLAGGVSVTLRGVGLSPVTAVRFGANEATSVVVVSDTEVTATAPAATAAGTVDVTAVTSGGSIVAQRAFAYVDEAGGFAAFELIPHVIRPGGTATLVGQALDQGTLEVSIGGVPAIVGTRTFSTATLTVPAQGSAPRRSSVVATGIGTATLTDAATWGVTLAHAAPNSGPAVGGSPVSIVGTNIPPSVAVYIGASAATGVTVQSDTQVDAVTPRGSGGIASAVIVEDTQDADNEAVLPDGFTFLEPLTMGRVQPARGAVAGGTLVTVFGSGFGPSTVVKFGVYNAKDLKFVDSHTITCRTPKGAPGTVDVTVQRLTESDTVAGGFSYFDPRSVSGGLSGGPLVGTLNITVLDSTDGAYGAPVPGATVVLGLDSATPFQGTTDQRGQITFSDTALVKAQTVTAFKDFYESVTVTGVNAENLTVFMAKTGGGEPSSAMPPPPPPPSIISGRVAGFKSPRPLMTGEKLEARVYVAQTNLQAGPPFRNGPDKSAEKWRVIKDGGEYLVYTGAGLRAVYAILGIAKGDSLFTPVAMGITRGITTSPEISATGKDIAIDIPLDVTVPVTIDSPLSFGGALATNSVYAWLELGAEGFVPNANNWNPGAVSSRSTSLSFPNFPRLDGTNFIFLNESKGTENYPRSYYFRRQPGELTAGVTIGPLLPAPELIPLPTPWTGTISWTMAPGAVPDLHNVVILRPTFTGNVTVWSMVLPGTENRVVVPQAAVDKLNREEAGASLFVAILSSRSPKFAYNQWTYETLAGIDWSSYTIAVSNSFTPTP